MAEILRQDAVLADLDGEQIELTVDGLHPAINGPEPAIDRVEPCLDLAAHLLEVPARLVVHRADPTLVPAGRASVDIWMRPVGGN